MLSVAYDSSVHHVTDEVFWRKDGTSFPVDCTNTPVIKEDEIVGAVITFRDISERKRAEEKMASYASDLERINRELDQFAYITSHDLKAPLRAIANLSQWIEEDLGDGLNNDTQKHMDLMRGRIHRMEAMINGILRYSRVGRVSVDTETVDIEKLLMEVIESLAPPEAFSVKIGSGMPILKTERVRLEQVFSNLIGNAIKYHHRSDGQVEVSARDIGDFYEFAVADDGPGIAPEYHDKIFRIFQTMEARDKVESTGIGLTIVKKIIEEQCGTIRLESKEGHGATFRFTWPKLPKEER